MGTGSVTHKCVTETVPMSLGFFDYFLLWVRNPPDT